MPKVKFSVTPSLDEVAKPFRRNYQKYLDRKIEALARLVWKNIQAEAPVRTGALRRSIIYRKRANLAYEVTVDERAKGGKYEPFVRLGVSPARRNPILPVRKKALYWPGALHPVRAVYNHPGMKANPYWDRGLQRSTTEIDHTEALIGAEIEAELISGKEQALGDF